jgi:hypothetical protein
MKGKLHIGIWLLCGLLAVASGCRKLVGPTKVTVVDNFRHYVPMIQGDILRMYWTIRNDGPEPLVIDEIQPACSAIKLMTELPDVVIQGDSIVMIFDFDTDKNTNMATHFIRIFGNILPEGEADLLFDVNIVRHTLDYADYEERYFSRGVPDDVYAGRNVRVGSYYIIPANADNLLGL